MAKGVATPWLSCSPIPLRADSRALRLCVVPLP